MNEATTKLIEDLAAKLGTTVEHLWGVLIRQAPMSCAFELLSTAGEVAVLAWLTRWLWKQPPAESCKDDEFFAPRFIRGAFWIMIGILWLVAFGTLGNIGLYVSGFTNPEYWALKQLLK